MLGQIIEGWGIALVVSGVALVSAPAALIVAGVLAIAAVELRG